jgi:hypothetical protein
MSPNARNSKSQDSRDCNLSIKQHCSSHPMKLAELNRLTKINRTSIMDNTCDQRKDQADRACGVCRKAVACQQSVLLMCTCIVCRSCAIDKVLASAQTYRTPKLTCPNHRCPTRHRSAPSFFTIGNICALEKWENEMLRSAVAYFGLLLPATVETAPDLFQLLRLFEAFGRTDVDTTHTLISSLARMRLQIAILEERRLNGTGLICTLNCPISDAEYRWGILRAAYIPHHPALERRLQLEGTVSCAERTDVATHVPVAKRIEQELIRLAAARTHMEGRDFNWIGSCNALDQLVWVAMFMHRNPVFRNKPFHFTSEASVCTAVGAVLQRMSHTLGSAVCNQVRERAEEGIRSGAVLERLVALNLVQRCGGCNSRVRSAVRLHWLRCS